jgi:hypothetical protein
VFKKIALISLFSLSTLFANDAKSLMEKNCASCHLLTTPTPSQIPTLKAPAFDAVAYHLGAAIKDKKRRVDFVVDYVLNPDISKSVCESNRVQKFGVMPSLKGKVNREDLIKIATYLVEHYPNKSFVSMITSMQKNDKINQLQNSPFLINKSALPHLTKLLIQNWDKGALGLTKEQKEKLLKVRKTTLGGVKKLKEEISSLEDEVIESMVDREDISKLDKRLQEIAKLKIEATKLHLKCISDTLNILNDKQIEYLLPLSDFNQ